MWLASEVRAALQGTVSSTWGVGANARPSVRIELYCRTPVGVGIGIITFLYAGYEPAWPFKLPDAQQECRDCCHLC